MWKWDDMRVIYFMNGVTIHFNMLGTLLKHWVSNDLNCTNVICIEWSRLNLRKPKLTQHSMKLNNFITCRGHNTVLRHYRRFRHPIFFFPFLRKKRVTNKHAPTSNWTSSIEQQAQSASLYITKQIGWYIGKKRSQVKVPFK